MKKRIFNTVLGSLITGVGVSITINAHLGLDPLSGVYNVVANIGGTNLSVGILIVSFVMLLITFIKDRKLIGLGTIVNPLMVSLMIEFVPRFTLPNMLWIRILVLMVGFTIISLGTILYIKGDLGVAPYDAITILFADLINMSFGRAKLLVDFSFAMVAFIYFGRVQIAPLIAVFYVGPMIDYLRKYINE